jgi:hypothetical protein
MNGPEAKERVDRHQPTGWTAKLGFSLLVLSVVLWLPLPVLPFLRIEMSSSLAIGGAFVLIAEIAFWVGAALAGPEAARRMRSWWRRAPETGPVSASADQETSS